MDWEFEECNRVLGGPSSRCAATATCTAQREGGVSSTHCTPTAPPLPALAALAAEWLVQAHRAVSAPCQHTGCAQGEVSAGMRRVPSWVCAARHALVAAGASSELAAQGWCGSVRCWCARACKARDCRLCAREELMSAAPWNDDRFKLRCCWSAGHRGGREIIGERQRKRTSDRGAAPTATALVAKEKKSRMEKTAVLS